MFKKQGIHFQFGDVLDFYGSWEPPVTIVSDGPYSLSNYPGDLHRVEDLPDFYEPHISKWTEKSTPQTTLWFWNSELGWATVHPLLVKYGWKYRCCNIWNKGIGHVAGNCNTQTLRGLPIVTEVCVQYIREPLFLMDGVKVTMKEWLRREWERTGLPFSKTNEACGVRNAATRKYFTNCHLWYCPPPEMFEKIVDYANTKGDPSGRPYFALEGRLLHGQELRDKMVKLRGKFNCEIGLTNVWDEPAVRGRERIKVKTKSLHGSQKSLNLMKRIIRLSTDPGDVVWDPFGGLCTGSVAALELGRKCFSAEVLFEFYTAAVERLERL
jgi:site-specific DNA-methyltransferase (adenine-specific)